MIEFRKIETLKEKEEFKSLVPRASDEDYEKLKSSVRKNGLLPAFPIIILRDGTVIDGYTRLQAAKELGVKEVPVKVVEFLDSNGNLDAAKLKQWIIGINTNRRHLTTAQKAELAIELEEIIRKERLKKRKKQIEELIKDRNTTPEEIKKLGKELYEIEEKLSERSIFKKIEPSENADEMRVESTSESRVPAGTRDEKPEITQNTSAFVEGAEKIKNEKIAEIVAKEVGISKRTFHRAKRIKKAAEKDPEIKKKWEEAKSGKIGIHSLYEKVAETSASKPQPSADLIIAEGITPSRAKEIANAMKEKAHLYIIVHSPKDMFDIQKKVDVSDVIVWEMDKKNNGRSSSFVLVVEGRKKRNFKNKTDIIKGNKFALCKKLLDMSGRKGTVLLPVNIPEAAAVAKVLGYGFEDPGIPEKKFKQLVKEAEVVKSDTLALVRWFWITLMGKPEEEFEKQSSSFFGREGKAAKALLKRHTEEEIKKVAMLAVKNSFFRKNGSLALLLSKWMNLVDEKHPWTLPDEKEYYKSAEELGIKVM